MKLYHESMQLRLFVYSSKEKSTSDDDDTKARMCNMVHCCMCLVGMGGIYKAHGVSEDGVCASFLITLYTARIIESFEWCDLVVLERRTVSFLCCKFLHFLACLANTPSPFYSPFCSDTFRSRQTNQNDSQTPQSRL